MDALIMAFGIFLNNFPYFMLGMALMWNHLRHGRKHAIVMITSACLLYMTSIMLLTHFLPPETIDKIRIPHEITFLFLYVVFFI